MLSMLAKTLATLEEQRIAGLHPGYQLYVSLNGTVVADVARGEARIDSERGPAVPLDDHTLMLWLSACKPVAAVCWAMLWERGLCTLDDLVTKFIPEFGQNGKERITLRHILTHTGGFPGANSGWPRNSWEQTIAALCATPLLAGQIPGRTAYYHPQSSWFILGEIIRRIDGRPYEQYVREQLFEPLGLLDSWVGMPPEQFALYGERIAATHNTQQIPARIDPTFKEERIVNCSPGGNAYGPVRDLGAFYEAMLHHGRRDGVQLLSPQTVAALTARHRTGLFDGAFKHVIDWGLGFIINSNQYGAETVPYGFGPHASPRTFGHSGNQSSCGFCDPERGLVVAWACNGQPGEAKHQRRANAINRAIYEDLGFSAE
jgi:CubicO group peptidase (beta-lactamase class C family)